jgi:hypothetical protein
MHRVADTNAAIGYASKNGHVQVVQELMKDARVDPSAGNLQVPPPFNGRQVFLQYPRISPSCRLQPGD